MKTGISIALKGKVSFWIMAILFTAVGCVFAFVVPAIISDSGDISNSADSTTMSLVFSALGWILLAIGGTVLLLCIVSIYIRVKSPQNEETFYWWINFTGGMMGALTFAVPSAFIYPLFALLPEQMKQQAQNRSIILPIFTAAGILVGIGLFFLARSQFRGRPRWK